jgi:hypothetical protein
MTDAQKLDRLRELLANVSRAVRDLLSGVQRLYEKSRPDKPVDLQPTITD